MSNAKRSSVDAIMLEYSHFIHKNDKGNAVSLSMSKLSQKISTGTPRWVAYRNYIDVDILNFLKISAQNNTPSYEVFSRYVPIKEIGEKALRSIRRKILFPLIVFPLVVYGLGEVVDLVQNIASGEGEKYSPVVEFLLNNFNIISFLYWFFFVILFTFFPHKIPFAKRIFKEIEGMLVLASIDIMHFMKFSAGEMIEPLKKQFSIKRGGKRKDVNGLIKLLLDNKYISIYQGADLEMYAGDDKINEAVSFILEEKKEEAMASKDTIDSIVASFSFVILAVPLIIAIVGYMAMLVKFATMSQGVTH